MSKIKKIWNENKILFVLALILVVCLVVVVVVSLTYFYGSSDNPYGKRLDIMEKVPLSKNIFNDIENKLKSNEAVKETSIDQKGKNIYISISYVDDTSMDKAKEIASSVLELFTESELEVYSLEFEIDAKLTKENKKYTLMGARNASGSGSIVWNNYNIDTEEESKK